MNILSIGDLLLDVIVRYDPASGEAEAGPDGVRIEPGGSAANFAVHAARLGAKVRFYSRVGRDWAGDMLARSLEADGLVSEVRVIDVEATGRVLVMVDPQGHRRMWSYPGASRTLSPDELNPGWFEGLDAFHLTGYSLLREGPREAALEAVRLARASGALLTLDPNPGHLIADYGPEKFRDVIAGLRFDILFPNLEEGTLLTGRDRPEEIATDLLDVSPMVALKLGEAGSLIATRAGIFEAPCRPAESVVDVTGAGDAFAAAFVVEYGRSRDAHAAAVSANRYAAGVVNRLGAR